MQDNSKVPAKDNLPTKSPDQQFGDGYIMLVNNIFVSGKATNNGMKEYQIGFLQ